MLVRLLWCLILASASLANAGCASLKDASAGHIGCPPAEITIANDTGRWGGSRTWTASCRGRNYSCAAVSVSEGAAQINCAPMDGTSGGDATGNAAPATSVEPTTTRIAQVARGFDERRGFAFVQGRFALDPGIELVVGGTPKISATTLVVSVEDHEGITLHGCDTLDLLVNARPQASLRSKAAAAAGGIKVVGEFNVEAFAALAQRFPEFGARACNSTWKLNEQQVEEMNKLLVIFADLVAEMQREAQVQPDAGTATPDSPGPTTL